MSNIPLAINPVAKPYIRTIHQLVNSANNPSFRNQPIYTSTTDINQVTNCFPNPFVFNKAFNQPEIKRTNGTNTASETK